MRNLYNKIRSFHEFLKRKMILYYKGEKTYLYKVNMVFSVSLDLTKVFVSQAEVNIYDII